MIRINAYEAFYNHVIYPLPPRYTEKLGTIMSYLPFRAGVKENLLRTTVLGKNFANPLIMASGYCNNRRMLECALRLGAAGATTKSITLNKRKGNTHPRLWRYDGGLINNIGLANTGLKRWVKELSQVRYGRIIGSIAGKSVEEFNYLYHETHDLVDLVEFNFSCPNVKNGLLSVADIKRIIKGKKDYLVKISLEHSMDEVLDLCGTITGGLTAVNTYKGVSGRAIYPKSLSIVRRIKEETNVPVIGVGGVDSPKKAWEMILNGANCVGLLTGFITKGPNIFEEINTGLLELIKQNKFSSLEEATGYALG